MRNLRIGFGSELEGLNRPLRVAEEEGQGVPVSWERGKNEMAGARAPNTHPRKMMTDE